MQFFNEIICVYMSWFALKCFKDERKKEMNSRIIGCSSEKIVQVLGRLSVNGSISLTIY